MQIHPTCLSKTSKCQTRVYVSVVRGGKQFQEPTPLKRTNSGRGSVSRQLKILRQEIEYSNFLRIRHLQPLTTMNGRNTWVNKRRQFSFLLLGLYMSAFIDLISPIISTNMFILCLHQYNLSLLGPKLSKTLYMINARF